MSLPEKPLTRREVYLAKATGQDVTLPEEDITREEQYLRAIAEGGGGGVTPEYVAEAIAKAKTEIEAEIPTKTSDLTNDSGYAAIDDTTAAQNKTYSSAKVEEKVVGEEITTTATGTDLTLSTSSGNLNALTVYGKSEVVDGAITSAGEGYAVVDLGALNWSYARDIDSFYSDDDMGIVKTGYNNSIPAPMLTNKYITTAFYGSNGYFNGKDKAIAFGYQSGQRLYVKDNTYPNPAAFKTAMQGVLLCYQLADPTQGNTIAVKTDNGSGIDGTMAVFETGTPLRGIPDTDVRDVMTWDGSSGEVTKNCGGVDLGTLNWIKGNATNGYFYSTISGIKQALQAGVLPNWICSKYNVTTSRANQHWETATENKVIGARQTTEYVCIVDNDYATADATAFKDAMSGVMLIYELATPTTSPLTQTENESLSALKTYSPQTAITINNSPEFEVEAYANTANGQTISDMQPTRSPLLTLSASGWTNNAQTVTFAHDTGKRNTIDVDLASIKAWTAAGILATAETASTITFECDTAPTADLSFRVTSMEVR